jgi:hypothetical protein
VRKPNSSHRRGRHFIPELDREGVTDVSVKANYKVGTSEFFEFSGKRGGNNVEGAGSTGSKLINEKTCTAGIIPDCLYVPG